MYNSSKTKKVMDKVDFNLLLEDDTPKVQYKIYCDMDGVLTDFEKRFFTKLQQEGPKYYKQSELQGFNEPKDFEKRFGAEEFWKFIDQHIGISFWVGMDWMPEGKRLWDYIKPHKPELLTSPSKNNVSRLGKNLWVRNNLNPKPKVNFAYSKDKQIYAQPNAILIDDKKSNINEWQAKGGIAIRCKNGNVDHVIEKLQELGL